MASEVQKGNAPEERKIQRLFRDPAVTRLIKRCNDFGAGGVSVAIGELADGLSHRPGRACARSTTVWTAPSWPSPNPRSAWPWWWPRRDVDAFIAAAARENLESYPVACGH